MAISIDQLAAEINRQLAQYANGVGEEIDQLAKKIALEGVTRLKLTSPTLTNSYAKGWRAKKVEGKWVVHNATNYQLTHLLEKSHALRNGGRSTPQVHIQPVEEQMVNEFITGIEEVLRR